MSISLLALRRSLGTRTQQPFFRLFGETARDATGGTTTTLIDTAGLTQPDDFWNGQTVFLPTTIQSRYIADFAQSTKTLTFLEALSGAVISGDDYEIWSSFTPMEIRSAINAALRDAWPFFFATAEARLVIQNGVGTSYSLSSLSPAPRMINKVYLEDGAASHTGNNTSTVAQNRLIDSNHTFTSADVGKEIRIYEGTSQGDIRTISSIINANTVQVSSNFTSILTTTSKYRLVNTADSVHNYSFLTQWSTPSLNNPTTLRLGGHPYGFEGYVLRLLYEAEYPSLSLDADTTDAPQEYVELAALARLYSIKLTGAPSSEIRNWGAAYQSVTEQLQAYTAKNRYSHLPTTFLEPERAIGRVAQEYPFR